MQSDAALALVLCVFFFALSLSWYFLVAALEVPRGVAYEAKIAARKLLCVKVLSFARHNESKCAIKKQYCGISFVLWIIMHKCILSADQAIKTAARAQHNHGHQAGRRREEANSQHTPCRGCADPPPTVASCYRTYCSYTRLLLAGFSVYTTYGSRGGRRKVLSIHYFS